MAVAVRREFGTQVTLGRGGAVLRTAIPKVTNSKEGVTFVFGGGDGIGGVRTGDPGIWLRK